MSPNWSEGKTRRGRVQGGVVNVYTKEQLAQMSVDEINAAIAEDLYEDAYARQLEKPARYKGKNLAVRMENLLFRCPSCEGMDTMVSHGDTVECKKCGLNFKYTEYGMLEGISHNTVRELFAWQRDAVEQDALENVAYTANGGTLYSVAKHEEKMISQGAIVLDSEKISCGDTSIMLKDITDMAMHGRRALVFSTKEEYYELIPSEGANSLKFHMLYQAYKYGSINQYKGSVR